MVLDFSPNQTDTMIIEIHPSTYNIRMFSRNSLGRSEASNVLTITVGETGDVVSLDSTISVSSCLSQTSLQTLCVLLSECVIVSVFPWLYLYNWHN